MHGEQMVASGRLVNAQMQLGVGGGEGADGCEALLFGALFAGRAAGAIDKRSGYVGVMGGVVLRF